MVLVIPLSKAITSFISQMELYVNKESYSVTKIKIIESGSDYSIITFSNLKINENYEDKIFNP